MALLITPSSAMATITVTKTLYDIVSLTTLSTIISHSLTADIADTTRTISINGTTSTFSPFASLTNNLSNITTSTTTKTDHASNPWCMTLLTVPVVLLLGIIWGTILHVFSENESRWIYFLRYGINADIRAEEDKASKERKLREAELKEQFEEQLRRLDEEQAVNRKKLDEENGAWDKRYNDIIQKSVDFSRIVRFKSRALNFSLERDELHMSDDYARFEATDGQKKLTDLEILKILILEHEEKYVREIEWSLKHPVEFRRLQKESGYLIDHTFKVEKRMRVERNDPVADERDRVEMCEKFGWDPTDPFYKLPYTQ
ncbi:uncharacterized protein EAE97_006713 [Botrytis byssoidea]|uniref:Uncharacterized protein n=1 Tax=Botrytis byssoidea TaxID=139641 RepID=A0A9P5IPQ4_9HELO|nr:uncharacterized protein EAE97_006713 [Botrytis byssoidea]KAF7941876.1 hypothetical protein EAE97_006713 [Botrytis byssoidea]